MSSHRPYFESQDASSEPLTYEAQQNYSGQRPTNGGTVKGLASKFAGPLDRVLRIVLLLTSGYSTASSQRRLEKQADWGRFRKVLMIKLQNIGVVSGLLLASNVNLLCIGPTRRMTYVTCLASIYMSLLSIIFGLLCLWSIVGVHPSRLKELSKQTYLFYYLNSTPSLFGGMSALAFFVAVGAWVWLETDQGIAARILVVLLGAALIGNAAVCFVLGAVHWESN
ncbi:hypothetical protein RSOLAG1IB_08298 [Rhizoctonia solani AG-1 IB]|uniref:Uncharacterized protein n=1 Tax=Thanatephorus cucumeris (strain AG1-IB / isolate 7/3/14) TaxID=1108050 RepID=A0A0B7FHE1_THACB|nr:hypothetical protein RSOLAG1IB_08298 [Rhizoctonia solani AG-1 IB]